MQLHMEAIGKTGLVMHNGRLADPLEPRAIELKKLTGKRTKTEEDHREIADFEWLAGLYYTKDKAPDPEGKGKGSEIGVYLPAENIVRCLHDAATAWKLGEAVYDFVHVSTDRIPVRHDGPADLLKLQKLPEYRLRKTVRIGAKRTARTRPIFRTWSMSFDVDLDDADLNLSDFRRIVERAGRLEGVGTARKLGFGRFIATLSVAA